MKQYIVRFLKTRFLVIFGGATLFYELFFFALLWCKTAVDAPPSALWVYVPALVWYLLDILLAFRFRRLSYVLLSVRASATAVSIGARLSVIPALYCFCTRIRIYHTQ